jgi:hypothetical protein
MSSNRFKMVPPAAIGAPVDTVKTPSLLVDLDTSNATSRG